MASPSSVITLGLNFTPSLMVTLGYGSAASTAVLTRLRYSRIHNVPSLGYGSIKMRPKPPER